MGINKETRVGLAFFAGLALLLVLTVIIGRGELAIHRGYYNVDVLFENIQGLRRNDVVELSGMEIGRVDSIHMEKDMIRVRLRINDDYRIRKDARVAIAERSLIGGKMVAVEMGRSEETVAPGSVIEGETAPTPLELIKQASGFASSLEDKLQELDNILPEVASLAASLNRIASSIERGEGTLGKLITEDEVYLDLSETLKSAKSASAEIAKYTEGLDRVKTYIGADAAYNADTSRTLAGVYLRIEPRPEKLYLVGGKALTGSGTRWSEDDEQSLEIDLQIGRRWADGKLTGRAGLFESRLGAGLDYKFNERLSMTVEGRDVWTGTKDENISPFLLRGRFNLRLIGGLYLHAGADNLLDNPGLNAGIRFEYSDEDIKHLVGILSIGR